MADRSPMASARRIVVKVGSAILTDGGRGLDQSAISGLVEQMTQLRRQKIELVLVSSGAVVAGMSRLGWSSRPRELHKLQAAAAVGQMGLVQSYESEFQKYGLHTAQILLDHDDISARDRYLNARSTLMTLLSLNVIPVVNENDTVVTEEIRFGDNDTLAALVANLIDADVLIILTDQDGLYDANPRSHSDANLLTEVSADDPSLVGMAGEGTALGRGGMVTKIKAAQLAARSGTHTVIANGENKQVLTAIVAGESVGTLLRAGRRPDTARKQWLAGLMRTSGVLHLDAGATGVVQQSGRSLLPVGVSSVAGEFSRGDVVSCVDPAGIEIARGLVNYSAVESRRIIRRSSDEIEALLGYRGDDELIHRDNMVLV
ncbi:MAG: glutamate 5-kinase [Halieaceae bacterium]